MFTKIPIQWEKGKFFFEKKGGGGEGKSEWVKKREKGKKEE